MSKPSIELVAGRQNVWQRLGKCAKNSRNRAFIAVAYLGKGAAKLLPVKSGSILVVDASDDTVKAGQTHPLDLLELQNRGVRIFSYPNLHCKIYVFDRAAAIGSANASHNSAQRLIEAATFTSNQKFVADAKAFVRSVAMNEIGPEELRRLQKKYRPPLVSHDFDRTAHHKSSSRKLSENNIRIVKLVEGGWTDRDYEEQAVGEKIAKKRRKMRLWEVDNFRWRGQHSFHRGNKIMTITRDDSGKQFASPPGNILYIRHYKVGKIKRSMVYFEHPQKRRRDIKNIITKLGKGAKERLKRGGQLNGNWSVNLKQIWD